MVKKTKNIKNIGQISDRPFTLNDKIQIFSNAKTSRRFLSRLRQRVSDTRTTYKKLISKVQSLKHITHEVENLMDNYYVIDGAISDILNSRVSNEFAKLPLIESGLSNFIPRTYSIVSSLLIDSNYTVNRDLLYDFLKKYQQKTHLSIRELSFISFLLKTTLLEGIDEVMHKINVSLNEYKDADYWFKRIVEGSKKDSNTHFSKITSSLTAKYGVVSINLSCYLLQRLSQYGSDTRPIVKWLKLNLLKQGIDFQNLSDLENKQKNERTSLINNIVDSLRWINQSRWDDFVENTNKVDEFLKKDPAQIYSTMDSVSQSIYRRAVVKIADMTGIHESEVAKTALRLCRTDNLKAKKAEGESSIKDIRNHVGYHLVGKGREELERKVGYEKTIFDRGLSFILKNSSRLYFFSIFFINIFITTFLTFLLPWNIEKTFSFFILAVLLFVLNSEITINFINFLISFVIPVRPLPKLDLLESGVSDNQRTFVVIPSMFRDDKSSLELLRRLEINYLANLDKNIFFALLMDFKDSKSEVESGDEALVGLIQKGIDELNQKYPQKIKTFYFFYRKRLWNPQEKKFMGWERKRGKLREFNLLVRNHIKTSYVQLFPQDLNNIKYILTIDEDIRLPRDSAIKLIGCIDHPLNRPVVDHSLGKVISGYGIIQPKMTTKFVNASSSTFAKLFSSSYGIDSYSGPVADVYQDLFGNSLFFGKGIYDIDVMEEVIGDKIDENLVLSHDLLEGLYTRVGFASDISLFEGFPSSFKEYSMRMHRWIRGDWQIISWLGIRKIKQTRFSFVDKWKIFDNLRRSLIPVFLSLFIFLSYFNGHYDYRYFFLYTLFVTGSSYIFVFLFKLFSWPRGMTFILKLRNFFDDLELVLTQTILRFVFVLDYALTSAHAVISSLYRMFISHKNLLQWQNSHEVSRKVKGTFFEFVSLMFYTIVFSVILLFWGLKTGSGFFFNLTAVLWLLSPFFAFIISRSQKIHRLSTSENLFLRKIACRSSRFFLDLSNRENNNLIPDHFQETPKANSPSSTSPTNLGMLLLGYLSSFDFGYIGLGDLLYRLKHTLRNLSYLERYKGHFLNWYNINTRQSLVPKYVSTVDSANFLLSLIVLKQGIFDVLNKPVITESSLKGFHDINEVLKEDASSIIKDKTLSKNLRVLSNLIYRECLSISKKIKAVKHTEHTEDFIKLLDSLSDNNENIKKIISRLNLDNDREPLHIIFSSAEHFNVLLKQQKDIVSSLLSFYNMSKNRPALRDVKNNKTLSNAFVTLDLKFSKIFSVEYLAVNLKADIDSLHISDLILNSVLDNSEKERLDNWYHTVCNKIEEVKENAQKIRDEYLEQSKLCEKFFEEADFSFLYNKERGLFHIGYNVSFEKIDNSYYDFLASEANSASFVSIVKGQVPLKHWFYLGRKIVRIGVKEDLLSSWGGSLFEYLTSLIFFKVDPNSLLGKTAEVAIDSHIKYGRKWNVPWGMGESAYSVLDINNNYQYQIFGHPSLGLKRDLGSYLVVAPYTTIMSLSLRLRKSIKNLKKLMKAGVFGRYGFYDSIDYTKEYNDNVTVKTGEPSKIFYAHHQGFSLASLNNAVNSERIRNLFLKDPRVEALDTLFEEKMPSTIPSKPIKNVERLSVDYSSGLIDNVESKQYVPALTSYVRRAFISNGSYSIGISNTGANFSRVKDIQLTRFREDQTLEPWGQFIYLRDIDKKNVWSPTTQPFGNINGKNKIIFYENKVEFNKINNGIESLLHVSVSSDKNVEFRKLVLTNHNKEKKNIEISSYGEVALTRGNQDLDHTFFQKLFVKSEYISKYNAQVYSRIDTANRGKKVYFAHCLFPFESDKGELSHTFNRENFVGRGGSLSDPEIFKTTYKESKINSEYNLDSIFSIQKKIEIKPNEKRTFVFVNIFSESLEEITNILKLYSRTNNINSDIKKSERYSLEVTQKLGISSSQAMLYQGLASRILSPHYSNVNKNFPDGISEPLVNSLWRSSISGDHPMVVVRIYDLNDIVVVRNMLICFRYLKSKGVLFDLVFLNEYPASYAKAFEDEVDFLIRYNQPTLSQENGGKIYHLRTSFLSKTDSQSIWYLAKVNIDSKDGPVDQQIENILQSHSLLETKKLETTKKILLASRDLFPDLEKLSFYNGIGGFDLTNLEYVMNINYFKKKITPLPWVNIIANKDIGFVITESGSTYSWIGDSYDNRISKKLDDPITDRSSEVLYLRDEETGEVWNPTPLPIKSPYTYTVSHGLGYTKFKHQRNRLEQEVIFSVAEKDSVKIIKLRIKNNSNSLKRLSATYFVEMTLGGVNREDTKDYLKIEKDQETGTTIIRNFYGESFKKTVAFLDLEGTNSLVTNDRSEFLGKNGSIKSPFALKRTSLSNSIRSGVDNCVVKQTFFALDKGEEKEITILFGGGNSIEDIRRIVSKYRQSLNREKEQKNIELAWRNLLDKIQIKTPDESLNIMFNSQLLYQTLSSRLIARSGYYQSSGAYGFRDQLQDACSLVWSEPGITRDMILKASRHQFLEGDTQTWWHEHNSFGLRTVFSDHQLWLPFAVSHYMEVTGDKQILDEQESYIKGPILNFKDSQTWVGVPEMTPEKYDIYDHCIRSIEKTLVFGKHGLPLIGVGDWNDGLNKVGEKGLGESIWLGWFLFNVLKSFIPIIKTRGDIGRAERYETTAENLRKYLEKYGWDGKWYKRAFSDEGLVLGSHHNRDFKIDSIAQSWSVISRGASQNRASISMNSVKQYLFQDQNLLTLIHPALKEPRFDLGYIKDYPPGIRENGAQYNHAALWAVQAFSILKDSDTAMKILDSVNPIKRSKDFYSTSIYKVEPYVVASDIYAKPAEAGRGGWTWYTGSAGVMYRTILENILGFKLKGDRLTIEPCIPKEWKEFAIKYLFKNTEYNIKVNNVSGKNIIANITLDGEKLIEQTVILSDDKKKHNIEVEL